MKWILLLIPMAGTYALGVGLDIVGAYEVWYPTSPIMHALGGFVTAWTVWHALKLALPTRALPKHPLIRTLCVLGGVLLIGVLWEWYELILDILYDTGHIPGVGDTLIDLLMDSVGALVYSFATRTVDK